jgi:hypothetical protein
MNCKGCGRKRSWPNFKILSWQMPEMTERNHEKLKSLSQNSRSPGRDLNAGPSEYEAEMLTSQSRRSVTPSPKTFTLILQIMFLG